MEIVEFGALTDELRAQLEGGEDSVVPGRAARRPPGDGAAFHSLPF